MGNSGIDFRERQQIESKTELEIKLHILEKVRRRMAELRYNGAGGITHCPELNPDVIVISGNQIFLFEPQNVRASEVLYQRCGLNMEAVRTRERIRVHPCDSRKIIAELKIAGLNVIC